MFANLKIRDVSGWTMVIFGVIAFLLGLLGLIHPEFLLLILGFAVPDRAARLAGDYTIVFLTASAMASFNIGVYYILAALNDLKPFYRWTVPFRMLTFVVFTIVVLRGLAPVNFMAVGAWELTGAIATALALRAEHKK